MISSLRVDYARCSLGKVLGITLGQIYIRTRKCASKCAPNQPTVRYNKRSPAKALKDEIVLSEMPRAAKHRMVLHGAPCADGTPLAHMRESCAVHHRPSAIGHRPSAIGHRPSAMQIAATQDSLLRHMQRCYAEVTSCCLVAFSALRAHPYTMARACVQ